MGEGYGREGACKRGPSAGWSRGRGAGWRLAGEGSAGARARTREKRGKVAHAVRLDDGVLERGEAEGGDRRLLQRLPLEDRVCGGGGGERASARARQAGGRQTSVSGASGMGRELQRGEGRAQACLGWQEGSQPRRRLLAAAAE